MKTYLRFLSRNKGYTAVNVVGLSVSLAFVIMIGLYVWYEWTTDRWHRNADHIYMLAMNRNDGNGLITANHWSIEQVLRDNFPEIERTCATGIAYSNMMLDDTRKKEVHILYTEDDFFQMFDFQILLGDTARLFPQANTVLLSESMARLLFGQEYPIGQTVRVMDGGLELTVSGVFRDFERTSFWQVDMVMPLDVPGTMIMNDCFGKEDIGAYAQSIFIMTKPHADLNSKIDDMQRHSQWRCAAGAHSAHHGLCALALCHDELCESDHCAEHFPYARDGDAPLAGRTQEEGHLAHPERERSAEFVLHGGGFVDCLRLAAHCQPSALSVLLCSHHAPLVATVCQSCHGAVPRAVCRRGGGGHRTFPKSLHRQGATHRGGARNDYETN